MKAQEAWTASPGSAAAAEARALAAMEAARDSLCAELCVYVQRRCTVRPCHTLLQLHAPGGCVGALQAPPAPLTISRELELCQELQLHNARSPVYRALSHHRSDLRLAVKRSAGASIPLAS